MIEEAGRRGVEALAVLRRAAEAARAENAELDKATKEFHRRILDALAEDN